MDIYTVAFLGHRYLPNSLQIDRLLDVQVRRLLLEKEYVQFLLGRNGEFDQCSARAIRRAKRELRNDNSDMILILPYPTAEYLNNAEAFERYYDNIEISHSASKAHPKAAIQIRNREMIDRADLIICYVEQTRGGAHSALEYAKKTTEAHHQSCALRLKNRLCSR